MRAMFTLPTPVGAIVLGACLLATPALADSVTLISDKDNTLYESTTGGTSNGAGVVMFAGRNTAPSNSIRRALLSFNVGSMIPAGSTILSATLTLNQDSSNPEDAVVSMHRVGEDWGEGTSTGAGSGGPATTGDATWFHRHFNTVNWTTRGGTFTAASSASTLVQGNGMYSWTSPQLAADVQSFLDNPMGNFGWLLRGDETLPGRAKRFSTREEVTAELRPALRIEYVVPAPGGAAVLALSGCLCWRRARGKGSNPVR